MVTSARRTIVAKNFLCYSRRMGDMWKNFSWHEADCKDGTPVPQDHRDDALCVGAILQTIRNVLGMPIRVHSWYRTEKHNEEVAGRDDSLHLRASAVDFSVQGFKPDKVCERIAALIETGLLPLNVDVVVYEGHVHLEIDD